MYKPLLMTEEFYMNSPLSIVRSFGMINFNNHTYIIVDKHGRDIFECSRIAEKEGRDKAIEPGEPCDLVLQDLVPSYRKLGRDRIIELLREGKDADEIMVEAGFKAKVKKNRKSSK